MGSLDFIKSINGGGYTPLLVDKVSILLVSEVQIS